MRQGRAGACFTAGTSLCGCRPPACIESTPSKTDLPDLRPSTPLASQYPAIRHHSPMAAPFARAQIFLKDARSRHRRPDAHPSDADSGGRAAQRSDRWRTAVSSLPGSARAWNPHFMTGMTASPAPEAQIFLKSGSKQDTGHETTQRPRPCDSRMRGVAIAAFATGQSAALARGDRTTTHACHRPAAYDNVRSRTAAQCSGSRATLGFTQCNRLGTASVRTIRTRRLDGRAYSCAIWGDRT